MRIKSLLGACALALAFNVAMPTYAADEISIHDVYQAAEAGNISKAQAMMEQVLRDHPDSAKAHYVEAELLAKQGKMAAASAELTTAEGLKPGLPFEKPQAVQALKAVIAGQAASPTRPQETQTGFGMGSLLLIVGLIVFIFFVGRAMGRRSNPVVYPANNGGNYGQQPYGTGMPMGGPVGGMGGGMGSGILGGLATGAALGAGMVAGEELMHHFTDGDKTSGVVGNANAGDSWTDSNDMGGNDFGMTDSGSWDDGGGGGDWT
ncbi:MAG: tetratricopeptide repeat protein [Candidatus Methylopumilus sp.]